MNRMRMISQDEEEGNRFGTFGRNRNRGGRLATTRAQHREWKREMRSNAACKIQSLIRDEINHEALPTSNNNNDQISR